MSLAAQRDTKTGCNSCGSRFVATVDGVHGRRCHLCPPTFSLAHAAKLAAAGDLATLASYVRTWAA